MTNFFSIIPWQKICLFIFSFIIVAFGQPAWNPWIGLLAAIAGFACFWLVLLSIPKPAHRFYLGTFWFTSVQIVQLSWFLSHPYLYIYAVLFFCALLMGIQWGILSIWIQPKSFVKISQLFALAGLWVIFEWSRLFIFSGLPFNPVGLSLSSSIYPLQLASIGGVFGLSFWVILTNLFFVRTWLQPRSAARGVILACAILFPYLFGWSHIFVHSQLSLGNSETMKVVLVQSALPIEEKMHFRSAEEIRQFILSEWKQVLLTLQTQIGQSVDLIVMPEYLVPYGTFHHVFPLSEVQELFNHVFGDISHAMPANSLLSDDYWLDQKQQVLVSNAYLAQTIANFFDAHVVIGFEDSVYVDETQHKAETYSAAFHFTPGSDQLPSRYEKQILVPMGEYIPFTWCQTLAAKYGIKGSFTCGKGAKLFAGPVPFGTSICYEEIYGELIRENRQLGAELLVNLTNDGWYPNSRLPKQHFDHARLRTVENGIPLVRACNTGVTGGIDSLGRIIGILGEGEAYLQEKSGSIYLDIPLYHYPTLYSNWGNAPIIAFSFFCVCIGLIRRKK